MNYRALLASVMLLCGQCLSAVAAQTPAPTPVPGPAPTAKLPIDDLEPAVNTSGGVSPPASARAEPANSGRQKAPAARSGNAQDRVDLDATQITGNRELPKVLYIVPWKRPELGDLVGRPLNSLLDEVLAPVDRDVFRRETRYFDALRPDQTAPPAAPAPAGSTPAAPSTPGPELRSGSQPAPPPGQ